MNSLANRKAMNGNSQECVYVCVWLIVQAHFQLFWKRFLVSESRELQAPICFPIFTENK